MDLAPETDPNDCEAPDNQVRRPGAALAAHAARAACESVAARYGDHIDMAPVEGRQALSVVWDREAEELTFPNVHMGTPSRFRV